MMNRFYSSVLALSFVVACDKLESTVNNSDRRVSAQSIDTKVDTRHQNVASFGNPNDYHCDGPPNIQHLFNGYNMMKEGVDRSGGADEPLVKRTYTVAEAEMRRAREALDKCNKNGSVPIVAQSFYTMARQYAISAIAWMNETSNRVGHSNVGQY